MEGAERDATVAPMEASSYSSTGDGIAPLGGTGPNSFSDPESKRQSLQVVLAVGLR